MASALLAFVTCFVVLDLGDRRYNQHVLFHLRVERTDVQRAISVPSGMGRRPKTFGIDFGLCTRRGHPQLSLEDL
jgi:hypothetical protein